MRLVFIQLLPSIHLMSIRHSVFSKKYQTPKATCKLFTLRQRRVIASLAFFLFFFFFLLLLLLFANHWVQRYSTFNEDGSDQFFRLSPDRFVASTFWRRFGPVPSTFPEPIRHFGLRWRQFSQRQDSSAILLKMIWQFRQRRFADSVEAVQHFRQKMIW